ncbi:hypothetical protein L7F22_000302 [Adiantum nelumboides]|nr:hypothetical protein [Adiantum nelumboides]
MPSVELLHQARQFMDELPSQNVVVWSALILGYVLEGDAEQALTCLQQMQHDGILPNTVTYICALNACASIKAAEKGNKIHDEIARQEICDLIDARGLLCVIITSSSEDDAQRFLQLAKLNTCSQQFNPVIGKEFSSLKPSPDPLLHVFKQWGAKPWHVLMVGDTPAYNIACGNAVGSLTCLVHPLFCYKNDTLPRQHRPTFKVHSLQELMGLIQRLQ